MYYYFELFSSMWDNSVIFSAPRTGFYYAQPVIEHRYVHLFCYKHPDGQPVIPPNYFTTSYMITIEYLEPVQGFYLSCFLQRKQFGEKMVPKEEVLYILTEAKSYVPLYFILFFESITEQSIHDEANYNHLG